MECLSCNRCCANFYFPFSYLKSQKFTLNLRLKGLPVCLIYFILQSGQANWLNTTFNKFLLIFLFTFSNFPMVFLVLKEIFLRLEFLHSFVIYLVCFPTYINFAHFVGNFHWIQSPDRTLPTQQFLYSVI